MYRLIRILSILAMFIGVPLIIGNMVFTDPIGKAVMTPFCSGEVITEEGFDSTTLYCLEGDEKRDMIPLALGIPMALILGGGTLLAFSYVFELIGLTLRYRRILKHGEPGQARITAIRQTGVRVNSQPMLKFELEVVQGPNAPYHTSVSQVISYFSLPNVMPGAMLAIKIDSRNPKYVAIDWDNQASFQPQTTTSYGDNVTMQTYTFGAPGQSANMAQVQNILQSMMGNMAEPSLKEKLQQLDEAKASGLLSTQEYELARQKLLDNL